MKLPFRKQAIKQHMLPNVTVDAGATKAWEKIPCSLTSQVQVRDTQKKTDGESV